MNALVRLICESVALVSTRLRVLKFQLLLKCPIALGPVALVSTRLRVLKYFYDYALMRGIHQLHWSRPV